MSTMSRWISSLALAAGIGLAAAAPAPAQASDDLVRVIVDVADVILHGGQPYYRHGNYGRHDRLVVVHDRYGRPTYYRQVPRSHRVVYQQPRYRPAPPPHARAWGHPSRNAYSGRGDTRCDRNGRCTVRYYDPRQDRNRGKRRGRW
ncbi:MAG: hypothetical protein GX538_00245 [Gammaproteobacteria bacterium]|nr:hypothetical protein [Gammaproteobacteria bacterium]